MPVVAIKKSPVVHSKYVTAKNAKRIESIDLLRGVVMIVMALDHVRDYFHADAFIYSPTDLTRTSPELFFTRWITHFCAPVFIFLAGVSAYLVGMKKTKAELATYLFTRGLWLVFAELFVISLFRTFNPLYPYMNLQVIWVIGLSMMILAALVRLPLKLLLVLGLVLIAGHNLLDNVHVEGNSLGAFCWAVLHEMKYFNYGHFTLFVHFPLLPWLGMMILGFCFGRIFTSEYDSKKRRDLLLVTGIFSLLIFLALRVNNIYGDPSNWSVQKNVVYSILSFFNVTKYPPSLLYALVTLGPALIFLALAEKPLNKWGNRINIFGRVPMFYYLAHILLIHVLALFAAKLTGYKWSDMVLSKSVYDSPALKGYGFNLFTVWIIWIALVIMLYPLCKWYDQYKRVNQGKKWWLTYV